MKIECIISDTSIPLKKRCELCLSVLSGKYNLSQKCYAICYLTYRHMLDGYVIDKDFLTLTLDYYFKQEHTTLFENIRWKSSILITRIYLDNNITDKWWWNYGDINGLSINPMCIINYLRLINLSIAHGVINNENEFCINAHDYGIRLFRHFWNVVKLDSDNFAEIEIAQKQIKILINLGKFLDKTSGSRKSFSDICKIDTTEPFNSLFKKILT